MPSGKSHCCLDTKLNADVMSHFNVISLFCPTEAFQVYGAQRYYIFPESALQSSGQLELPTFNHYIPMACPRLAHSGSEQSRTNEISLVTARKRSLGQGNVGGGGAWWQGRGLACVGYDEIRSMSGRYASY